MICFITIIFIFIIQNLPSFKLTYNVDFRPLNPIDGNPERLISNWSKLRGEFLDHKAKINNYFRLNGAIQYSVPYRLWRFNKAIKNNLSKQKEFQKNMESVGYKYVVCHSVDEFMKEIRIYLNL